MISATNISLARKGKTLLDSLSCTFDRSEFVAIIGPNGAGKSTLLQLLAGLFQPTSGNVDFLGKNAHAWLPNELAAHRAYLHQQQSVFESFTVEDVLLMGRSIHFTGFPKPEDSALVAGMLRDLNLTHRKDQSFNSLSGGEQQRVQFARTLLQLQQSQRSSLENKVLFLDEPLNNLDLHYQYGLLNMARDKVVGEGGLVIAVLHDLNITFQYADRVIILHEGQKKMDAPTDVAMSPELLSAIYNIDIRKIEQDDQLPYFTIVNRQEFNPGYYRQAASLEK